MKKGDIIRLNQVLKDAAKTSYNFAEIVEIRSDGNVVAYFEKDADVKGRKTVDAESCQGHSFSFCLYDIPY